MDNGRVVIMKSVPQPFWKTPPLKDPQALVLDPNAGVVVQTDGRLIQFATNGTVSADRREPPANRILNARMATPAGIRDIFSGEWSPKALVDFDIDGDGRNDIVIADDSGVVAYDQSGKTLLKIRSGDVGITATAGELDGLPGAELAIAVDHYGLVVLGRKT
jgi:hypothetical protein